MVVLATKNQSTTKDCPSEESTGCRLSLLRAYPVITVSICGLLKLWYEDFYP